MPSETRFKIIFAPEVSDHLDAIDSKFYSLIQEAIELQLRYEPLTETRNRKRLRRETRFGASWEIRCGPNNRFRVYYAVNMDEREVRIAAIGIKDRHQVFIGKERYDL